MPAYVLCIGAVGGVPCSIVAAAACRALMAFDRTMSARYEGRHLTDIYFVNIQPEVTCCMIDVFRRVLQLSEPGTQTFHVEFYSENLKRPKVNSSNNDY